MGDSSTNGIVIWEFLFDKVDCLARERCGVGMKRLYDHSLCRLSSNHSCALDDSSICALNDSSIYALNDSSIYALEDSPIS